MNSVWSAFSLCEYVCWFLSIKFFYFSSTEVGEAGPETDVSLAKLRNRKDALRDSSEENSAGRFMCMHVSNLYCLTGH